MGPNSKMVRHQEDKIPGGKYIFKKMVREKNNSKEGKDFVTWPEDLFPVKNL